MGIASASRGKSQRSAIRQRISGLTIRRKTSAKRGQMRRRVVRNGRSQGVQGWTRSLASEHGNLLTNGEDLQRGIAPCAEEKSEGKQDRVGKLDHGPTFVSRCNG
jgi:hypothetical protein